MAEETRAERRRRVLDHLTDPLMAPNSNADLARLCGVTPSLVARIRDEVEAMGPAFLKGSVRELPLSELRLDGGTQSRARLDKVVSREYRDALKGGVVFPPVGAVYDGTDYWIWDGFHRVDAYRMAGYEAIRVEIRQGTRRDAVLLAAGANSGHGLRRSNDDKRRAVEHLLRDPEWVRKSDHWIAHVCHVSQPFVGKMRSELGIDNVINARETQDGRMFPVSSNGHQDPSALAPVQVDPPADDATPTDDEPDEDLDDDTEDDAGDEEAPPDDATPEPEPDHAHALPEPARPSSPPAPEPVPPAPQPPPEPPTADPVWIDPKVRITLHGDAQEDAGRLLGGYPKGELRRLARMLAEALEEDDDEDDAPAPEPAEGTVKRQILECLRMAPGGVTAEEIESVTGLSGNTVRPRLGELRRGGWAIEADAKRPTASGHPATVWLAANPDHN